MKRLLLLSFLLMPVSVAHAETPHVHCPGENTFEMRYCARLLLVHSDRQLQQMTNKEQFKQWQEATRALSAKAYEPYHNGTIYPQLVVGCNDHLNKALLKEFQPLGN
jgi:hypothetical protein